MLCDWASEELVQLNDDIRATVEHYSRMHNSLSQAIKAVSCSPERNLLKVWTLDLERIVSCIWPVASCPGGINAFIKWLANINRTCIYKLISTVFNAMVIEAYAFDSDYENDCDIDSY